MIQLFGGVLLVGALLAGGGCVRRESHAPETAVDGGREVDEMPDLSPVDVAEDAKLRAVATTSIVGDVVHHIGGELINLETLLPLGADPHAFEPTPQDAAAVAGAHVVFASGAGLELFLERLLESVGAGVPVVPVSRGVNLLAFGGEGAQGRAGEAGGSADPHTWHDPNNVMIWVDNIANALTALDPDNAAHYAANAQAYRTELRALDGWIQDRIAQVPEANRKLVTDHTAFSYFAERYGFKQIGAVVPGYSTLAEPSARELAALQEAIGQQDVRAVFVGLTVNPDLAERVAQDTGTKLVFLYTGSLSNPEGPAGDYVSLMKHNVDAIVEALR